MATTFTLNTGAQIPAVGLGTWQSGQYSVAAAAQDWSNMTMCADDIALQTQDRSRRRWLTP